MAITDVLQQGILFTNADPAAQEMLADFKDHKVGVKLDNDGADDRHTGQRRLA